MQLRAVATAPPSGTGSHRCLNRRVLLVYRLVLGLQSAALARGKPEVASDPGLPDTLLSLPAGLPRGRPALPNLIILGD